MYVFKPLVLKVDPGLTELSVLCRHRPRSSVAGGTESSSKPARLHAHSDNAVERLSKPFKCPGSATRAWNADVPARKRRKVNYAGADGSVEDGSTAWTNDDRLALANRDVNKFGIFKVKDKDTTFRKRFAVPMVNKDPGSYDSGRPAPTLGMRQGATFIVKPLHDPSGEFAIVLYDPTVDDKPKEAKPDGKDAENGNAPKIDAPLVHKSLADILGIKKDVEDRPKVPVVIDPRLAKVLRPHQVEGVKVSKPLRVSVEPMLSRFSSFTAVQLA